MMELITEKQKIAIANIEKVLNIKFEGSTKQEAWLWMREYMPKAVESETQKALSATSQHLSVSKFPRDLDNLMSEEKLDDFEKLYDFDGALDKEIHATKRYLGFD